jgi:hypothetical protein
VASAWSARVIVFTPKGSVDRQARVDVRGAARAHLPVISPSSLLRPDKPFIFLLACKHWAGSRLSSATIRIVGPTYMRLDSNSPVEPART